MYKLHSREFVPANWFQQLAFCEYQFFLEKIRKIKIAPSTEMLAGISSHNMLYNSFLENAETVKESFQEHIARLSRKEIEPFLVRGFYIKSQNYGLRGRIDEIRLFQDKAIIIDDKPRERAGEGDKMQLRAYSLAFSDMFSWGKGIFTAVRSTISQEIVFLEEFGEKEKSSIVEAIDRLKLQLDGQTEFRPTSNPMHCAKCRFRNLCGHSLV